jgi:predicted transcriptional regulator
MLDQTIRTSILTLREAGHGTRSIARALGISRGAVKSVLADGRVTPPMIERDQKCEVLRDEIVALHTSCKGNLVRVHEELLAHHPISLSYQALTAFCRREGIGHEPPAPTGHYTFEPGQEMRSSLFSCVNA